MSTALLTQADTSALLNMSEIDVNRTVSQMTALMNAIAGEKQNIDGMVTMLEKQPWYKKMWLTISGKNKATVADIQKCKDKLTAYTAESLAVLYDNNRIQQGQIIALGNAVNSVNSQLAATNYELLKTQEAFAQLKDEIIGTIGTLANKLNEKITSVDNYHLLLEDITLGTYDCSNTIAAIFMIIAQLDKRMAEDDRKMRILQVTLKNKAILTDEERTLTEYMKSVAELPDEYLGTVYYEFACLNGNDYAQMFCELIESYSMLPKMEKKSKKLDVIISNILTEHDTDSDTTFSTNEIYDYFIEGKKDYLLNINEVEVHVAEEVQPAVTEIDSGNAKCEDVQSESDGKPENSLIDRLAGIVSEYIDPNSPNTILNHLYKISGHVSYFYNDLLSPNNKKIISHAKQAVGKYATGEIIGYVDESADDEIDGLLFTSDGIGFDFYNKNVFVRYDEIDYMRIQPGTVNVLTFYGLFEALDGFHLTTDPSISDFWYQLENLKEMIETIQEEIGIEVKQAPKHGEVNDDNSDFDELVELLVNDYIDIVKNNNTDNAYDSIDLIHIEHNIIVRAKKTIGQRATGKIVGLIDTSLKHNGNDGLLFTTNGIAFDFAFEKVFLRYDEIEYMDFNKRETELRFHGTFKGVEDSGKDVTVPTVSSNSFDIHNLKKTIENIKDNLDTL